MGPLHKNQSKDLNIKSLARDCKVQTLVSQQQIFCVFPQSTARHTNAELWFSATTIKKIEVFWEKADEDGASEQGGKEKGPQEVCGERGHAGVDSGRVRGQEVMETDGL